MKNGFTLVELLAVIVILAVLALIATPVVLSIIDDAKESAMLRSAEMYLSGVENAVMRENMNSGGNFRPSECTITNGNMTCSGTEVEVEVDGEVPSTGSITFENGKITEVTLNYESGTIIKDSNGSLVYEGSESGLKEGMYIDGVLTYTWEELQSRYAENNYHCSVSINGNMLRQINGNHNGPEGAYHLVISDDIMIIEAQAAYAWPPVDEITLPKTITKIEPKALASSSIKKLNYKGTMEQWEMIELEEDELGTWNLDKQYDIKIGATIIHCIDGDISI